MFLLCPASILVPAGVEHLLRNVKDATISTLASDVSAKLQALKGLKSRLADVQVRYNSESVVVSHACNVSHSHVGSKHPSPHRLSCNWHHRLQLTQWDPTLTQCDRPPTQCDPTPRLHSARHAAF
jgi:hypothetical protein